MSGNHSQGAAVGAAAAGLSAAEERKQAAEEARAARQAAAEEARAAREAAAAEKRERAEQLKAERQAAAEAKKRAAQAAREAKMAARSTGTQRFNNRATLSTGTVGFRKSTQAKRPSTLRGASSNEEGQSIEELREAFERAVAKVAKAEKALNDPFSQVLPFVKAQREKNLERAEEAAEEARAALNRAQLGATGKVAAIALGAIALIGGALLNIDTSESGNKPSVPKESASAAYRKSNPKVKIAKKLDKKQPAERKARTQIFYAPKKKPAAPGQDYYAEMMKSLEAPRVEAPPVTAPAPSAEE
eukprot:scaffold2268_cov349-Prasinococcus_capsulatus_cf.AAC.7